MFNKFDKRVLKVTALEKLNNVQQYKDWFLVMVKLLFIPSRSKNFKFTYRFLLRMTFVFYFVILLFFCSGIQFLW